MGKPAVAAGSLTMPSASPLISLSVVSHGDRAELAALLESLAAHEPIDRLQLLVTDNLGDDLSDIDAGGWHSVTMFRPARPLGFALNHNLAFERALGQYLCILNPDVVFQQGVLARLVDRVARGDGHIVAPIMHDSRGQLQDSFRELPTPMRILRRRLGRQHPPLIPASDAVLHPDWIAGTFMFMARDTFSLLGGFNPRYRLYFEDVDLCTRARLQGLTITVDPALQVLHDARRASRRPGPHFLWHLHSALRFFVSPAYARARRLESHA